KMVIESTDVPYRPPVSIVGNQRMMNNLVIDETPSELTNRFIMNYNIAPGYYPDMVPPAIGKRPVYTARNVEADIPEIIMINKANLVGHDAGCFQPQWSPRCV